MPVFDDESVMLRALQFMLISVVLNSNLAYSRDSTDLRAHKLTWNKSTERSIDWKNFYANHSCKTLLSQSPPEWISSSPQSGIFSKPSNWGSICTLSRFELFRKRNPTLKRAELISSVSDYYVNEMDACATPKKDRFSTEFKLPSQREEQLKAMNAEQRTQRAAEFKRIQETSALSCCGSDLLCLERMRSVELKFCKQEADPSKPDRCVGRGTFYHRDFDQTWFRQASAQKDSQSKVDLTESDLLPGSVTISPFVGEDSDHDYFHELGHACNQIKRKIAIRRGSASALTEYLESEPCALTSAVKATYRNLFISEGMSESTAQCLIQRAAQAVNARYENKPCDSGCPFRALDEAHAVAFSLLALADKDWVREALPMPLCHGTRDSRHPLPADIVQCLLLTPSIHERFQAATGCTK